MTIDERVSSLSLLIGDTLQTLKVNIGVLSTLNTVDKANLVSAINELKSTDQIEDLESLVLIFENNLI